MGGRGWGGGGGGGLRLHGVLLRSKLHLFSSSIQNLLSLLPMHKKFYPIRWFLKTKRNTRSRTSTNSTCSKYSETFTVLLWNISNLNQ